MTDLDAALVLLSLKHSPSQEFNQSSPSSGEDKNMRQSPEPLDRPSKHIKLESMSSPESSYGGEPSPPELYAEETPAGGSSFGNTTANLTHSFRVDPQGIKIEKHIVHTTVSKRPFGCEHCGRGFARREHLFRHIETMHHGQKDFECQFCSRVFSRKDNMMQHMRNKHSKSKQMVV